MGSCFSSSKAKGSHGAAEAAQYDKQRQESNTASAQRSDHTTSTATPIPYEMQVLRDRNHSFPSKTHTRNNSVQSDHESAALTDTRKKSSLSSTPNASMANGSTVAQQNRQGSASSSTNKQEIKILLLGSGESGKSTILKQMKIIHQNGYTKEELLMYKTTVYKNLLDCAKDIVVALERFGVTLDDINERKQPTPKVEEIPAEEETSNTAHEINTTNNVIPTLTQNPPVTPPSLNDASPTNANYRQNGLISAAKLETTELTQQDLDLIKTYQVQPQPDFVLDPEITAAIVRLWNRPIVRVFFSEKRSEFYIMDSAPYFFANVQRIGHPDYIPNVADILRARIKTTGIYETKFDMGGMNIHMYDVGGQRSERKKWIHCFDNVTLIIFCVALSEYDQVLLEADGQNRMAESLVLFESVVNSRWFMRTAVVLFLNKIDVFTEKLPHSPLENFFPDYTGGNDINKAAKYILWRFTRLNRAGLHIYPHLTQATDTSNIRLVFAAVKETILQNSLKDSGIL
ncbi:guanine nucleotide-binding protein alpha-2 subunit [Trichomonascus vanleenenianus]|uniref:guanine nucleotide-binding protein subunit alpha n=1 Tax=Trichomonascus vanleenenianus TaxID=2268995 RepID=UPI003ECB32F1